MRNMEAAGLGNKEAMMISGHKTTSMIHRLSNCQRQDIQRAGEKMAAYEAAEKGIADRGPEEGQS